LWEESFERSATLLRAFDDPRWTVGL